MEARIRAQLLGPLGDWWNFLVCMERPGGEVGPENHDVSVSDIVPNMDDSAPSQKDSTNVRNLSARISQLSG